MSLNYFNYTKNKKQPEQIALYHHTKADLV